MFLQTLQLAQQQLLAQQLEAEHCRLRAEHQLLLECCDGMAQLRLRSSEHAAHGGAGYAAGELALLQQLQVRHDQTAYWFAQEILLQLCNNMPYLQFPSGAHRLRPCLLSLEQWAMRYVVW
jgi:hypothetical protein